MTLAAVSSSQGGESPEQWTRSGPAAPRTGRAVRRGVARSRNTSEQTAAIPFASDRVHRTSQGHDTLLGLAARHNELAIVAKLCSLDGISLEATDLVSQARSACQEWRSCAEATAALFHPARVGVAAQGRRRKETRRWPSPRAGGILKS